MADTYAPDTPPRRRPLRRLRWAGVVIVALALIVAGCSGDTTNGDTDRHGGHDDHSTSPGPQPTDDAGSIASTWLGIVYAWEPATDTSPTDALVRARALATGSLAAEYPPTGTVRNTLPQWSSWRSSGDVITSIVDTPDVTTVDATNAVARTTVTQTVLHRDGDTTPWDSLEVTVTLQKTLAGLWKVSDYRQIPAQQGGN